MKCDNAIVIITKGTEPPLQIRLDKVTKTKPFIFLSCFRAGHRSTTQKKLMFQEILDKLCITLSLVIATIQAWLARISAASARKSMGQGFHTRFQKCSIK